LKTQLEIQEQTFQTISRDIHDNINLSLTLAKLNLNTINISDKGKTFSHVNTSISFISKAINDLTDISRSMNSDIIIEKGLITALQHEIDKLEHLEWFTTQFILTGTPVFMDAQKELFIFRIVQEAFNNILKHANAKNVKLQLDYRYDHVDISLEDDGIGFNHSNGQQPRCSTAGLKNMQKRAELINGEFKIKSNPGNGTIIRFKIPFHP
jgi:signal transduction histidine kinase